MIQKVIKVGNSLAVTVPSKFIDTIKFPSDGTVKITTEPNKKRVIVDFSQDEVVESVVDKEVYTVAKQLLKRYLPAFKELSKK